SLRSINAYRIDVSRKASRAAIERAVDVLVALHTAGSVHGKGVEVQERVLSGERLTFPFARGAEFRDGLATSCDRDPLPLFGAGLGPTRKRKRQALPAE